MRRNLLSFLLNIAIVSGLVWGTVERQRQREAARFSGVVDWVSDGDTFQIADYPWPIRIWGVDAPERDTPEGQAARDFLDGLIRNQTVTCEKVAVDRYRRTVARCSLDGAGLSLALLNAGHGSEMCRFTGGELGFC